MPSRVPVIDLAPWFHGTADDRAEVARRVDALVRPERTLRGSVTSTLGVLRDIARRLTEAADTAGTA